MGKENYFPNFSKKHKFTFCNQSSLLHFVTKFLLLLLLLWKFGLFLDQDGFCSFLFLKKTWIWKRGWCIQTSSLTRIQNYTQLAEDSSRHWHLGRKTKSLQYMYVFFKIFSIWSLFWIKWQIVELQMSKLKYLWGTIH